jgi:hypothetical protein
MSFSYRYFLTGTLIKFCFGLIIYYQGKWMRKLFKPILKDYIDAETGVTNGVQMVKRHSKEMMKLRCRLRKNTCGCGILMLASLYIGFNCASGAFSSYIDQKYEFYNTHNMTNFTDSMDFDMFRPPQQLQEQQKIKYDFENEEPEQPKDFQGSIKQLEDYFGSFENFNHTMSLMRHHHRRFRQMDDSQFNDEMEKFKENPNKMWFEFLKHTRPEIVKSTFSVFIFWMMACTTFGCFVAMYGIQAMIRGFLVGALKAQKFLENKYMGSEIQRNQNNEPVIQYIPAPPAEPMRHDGNSTGF